MVFFSQSHFTHISGAIIGIIQLPLIFTVHDTMGGSTSYVTIVSQWVVTKKHQEMFPYLASKRCGVGNWWQVCIKRVFVRLCVCLCIVWTPLAAEAQLYGRTVNRTDSFLWKNYRKISVFCKIKRPLQTFSHTEKVRTIKNGNLNKASFFFLWCTKLKKVSGQNCKSTWLILALIGSYIWQNFTDFL